MGHVNARHTAQQMSKGMLTQAMVGGVAAYAGTKGEIYGQIASQLGMLGAGALLASYSRDNEREADHLGITYMTRAGYGAEGFVDLMAMLNNLHKGDAGAVSLLFATHPMSQERYDTALRLKTKDFSKYAGGPLNRERYMDHTAALRKLKPAIERFQQGEELMGQKSLEAAETALGEGLNIAPADYAGLVMMAKCQMMQGKNEAALRFSEKAKQVYPAEAQADHLGGLAKINLKRFDEAVADFTAYDAKLPGNPNTMFYLGFAYEGMGKKQQAAKDYYGYLQQVNQGEQAQHAYDRLVEWGVIKPSAQ